MKHSTAPQKHSTDRNEWHEAPLFRFDRSDNLMPIASPKIVWTAATALCDPSTFSVLPHEQYGIKDGAAYTVFFGTGSHGQRPSPIQPEIVVEEIVPRITRVTAAMFLVLNSPPCQSFQVFRMCGADLQKILQTKHTRKRDRLRELAENARLLNTVSVAIDHWQPEKWSDVLSMAPQRFFEIGVRAFSAGEWVYLEEGKTETFDYRTAKELEILVRPGPWTEKFLVEKRRQYFKVPKNFLASVLKLPETQYRMARALIDLAFRVRVAKDRPLKGQEILRQLWAYSDESFVDIQYNSQVAFAMAKEFERFLITANNFYRITCESRRLIQNSRLEGFTDGRLTYKDTDGRRGKGYWDTYLAAKFKFIPHEKVPEIDACSLE